MAMTGGRSKRKRLIKVSLETAKGTAVAGTTGILTTDLEANPTAPFEPSESDGLYLGKKEVGSIGELTGECSFRTELRSNGTSGIDAGLAILLQAASLKQTAEVYNLHSSYTARKTITIDIYEDGVKKQLVGAMGTLTIEGETGKKVWCNFTFTGRWIAPVDAALPAFTPGTQAAMKLAGGTFTIGGEAAKIGKFSLDFGNEVVASLAPNAAGGVAHGDIPDYDTVLSIDPEADLVANHDFNGIWLAGTTTAVSLVLSDGSVTFTFAMPKVEYREVRASDRNKIQTYDISGGCLHSSGDDAVTITAAAA